MEGLQCLVVHGELALALVIVVLLGQSHDLIEELLQLDVGAWIEWLAPDDEADLVKPALIAIPPLA